MKTKLLSLFLIGILSINLSFSQSTPIPHGSFNDALDIGFWSVASGTASKSWFNGGCQSLFVDNLGQAPTTITSSVFSVGLSGTYEMELEYAVIYTGTPAVFELIDSNNTVISAVSTTTVTGTCTDWPSPKNSALLFSNLTAGDYQLRISIPSCQFFLDGVLLESYDPIIVSGSVNNSGCANSNMIDDFSMKITNLGDNSFAFTSTVNGSYSFVLPNVAGNFLIEAVNTNGNVVSAPNGINLTVNSSSSSYPNNDFCLTSNISGIDVEAQLLSETTARPGFVADYNLIYQNNGNVTTGTESIVLNYDNSKMTFNSASVTPTSTTANSITWSYSNLTPLEVRNITMSFTLLNPPTTNSGDVLNFTGQIAPITDADPSNNTINLNQTVVNAYDPNDVLCLEGDEITPSQIGDDLTYRIRFQNTGTAAAVNINVKTDLDANLDWSTFQPISASHAYTVSVANGNELTFTFNNIYLDDSTTNEPGSHGWIFYKIKPKSTVVAGDSFDSTASIYFDFNPAVVTNTYTTTIVSPLTYVPDDNFENHLETHDANGDVVPLGDPTSMGNGIANDDYVTTSKIDTVVYLYMPSLNIADLTGIEDFVAIKNLQIPNNQLTTLNVSQNTALELFYCGANQLTSLDVSNNTALIYLNCFSNQITSLDVSNNLALQDLSISLNQITNLDVSVNINLNRFIAENCTLASLNIKNGNNTIFIGFNTINNPDLTCIEVDNATYSTTNWTNKDATSVFVNNQTECATLSNQEFEQSLFSVYPNPMNSVLNVSVKNEANFKLISVNGKVITNGMLQTGENAINVSSLAKGLYFIQVETEEGVSTKKIIKE